MAHRRSSIDVSSLFLSLKRYSNPMPQLPNPSGASPLFFHYPTKTPSALGWHTWQGNRIYVLMGSLHSLRTFLDLCLPWACSFHQAAPLSCMILQDVFLALKFFFPFRSSFRKSFNAALGGVLSLEDSSHCRVNCDPNLYSRLCAETSSSEQQDKL